MQFFIIDTSRMKLNGGYVIGYRCNELTRRKLFLYRQRLDTVRVGDLTRMPIALKGARQIRWLLGSLDNLH